MKSFKPRLISFYFSLVVAVLIVFIEVMFVKFTSVNYLTFVTSFVVVFVIVFVTTSILVNSIIERRLKAIFRIIRDVSVDEARKTKVVSDKFNLNFDVNSEVRRWAANKQKEIQRLKELEKYRKEFVGNVSHELKTPIFNIQGYILTLLEGGIDDTRINKLYLQRTVKSIDRMISIVEDLESINKLESGELKINKENFNIIKLTEEIFELEHMLAKERKISVEFTTNVEKPIMVHADRKRIMEALGNLIINALKYGKKGGYVRVGFFDLDDRIVVEVKDNGIGISKENLPRIFERFYRVDKHRSREQGGTGLGLAIVKHIMEAHEENITVKSQSDIGTTFNFTLLKAKV